MILLAPMQNHPSKKKLSALQRSTQARQRMRSIREEATAPGANTPLTLQVPSDPSYWAKIVSDNRPIDWANGERVGDPGKLSRQRIFFSARKFHQFDYSIN